MDETIGVQKENRHWLVYASYCVAGSLVLCFAAVFIQFLRWLFPTWVSSGTLFFCALAVLEAFLSFWLVRHLPTAQRQISWYRATELVLLFLVLKIYTDIRIGGVPIWNNTDIWPSEFPFNIITGQFILTILPVVSSWVSGNLFAADLSLLDSEEAAGLDDGTKVTPIRVVILRRFLSLGILVVLLTGIPAQKIIAIFPRAGSQTPIFPFAIAYFVLGIILLSLTRYITLATSWHADKLQVPMQLPRRWFTYSATVLVVLVLLMCLIPTNYGLGLLGTLQFIFHAIYEFVQVLFGLMLMFFSLVARLMGISSNGQAPLPQITPSPENLPAPANHSPFWQLVQSIFLWGALAILAFLALRQYIAFHRDLSDELRHFRPWRWLKNTWSRLMASFKKADSSIRLYIKSSLKRLRSSEDKSNRMREWEFFNPRALPDRQKVIFYYLALIRRAGEAGLPRHEDQTPYEYAQSLATSLKQEKEAVGMMTESFIEARYTQHEIPAKRAQYVKDMWESIRQVMKSMRRSRE